MIDRVDARASHSRRWLVTRAAAGGLVTAAAIPGIVSAQFEAAHPQIQEAVDLWRRNGIYNLTFPLDIIPQNTLIDNLRTTTELFTFPDLQMGVNRPVRWVEYGSSSAPLPSGSPDRLIRAVLPYGRNPIIVGRHASRYPGFPVVRQEWLFLNPGEEGSIRFENADQSWGIEADPGPVSILLKYANPGGAEDPITMAKLIYLEEGFMGDTPIPGGSLDLNPRYTVPTFKVG